MVFNGRLSTTDRATGKPAACIFSACLPNARCSRIWFLAAVESAARLTRLNALVSPNPYDLEAVEPIWKPSSYFRSSRDISARAATIHHASYNYTGLTRSGGGIAAAVMRRVRLGRWRARLR